MFDLDVEKDWLALATLMSSVWDNALQNEWFAASDRLTPDAGGRHYWASGAGFPGMALINRPGECIFFCGGLTGGGDWLRAITSAVTPLNPFQALGRSRFFEEWSNVAAARISMYGRAEGSQLTLVGHSAGGAALSLLAAGRPTPVRAGATQLLTFGAPKPDGRSLAGDLSGVKVVRLVNRGDVVTDLPPSAFRYPPLVALVGPVVAGRSTGFSQIPGGIILEIDGRRTVSNEPASDLGDASLLLAEALKGQDTSTPNVHLMFVYSQRVRMGIQEVRKSDVPSTATTTQTAHRPLEVSLSATPTSGFIPSDYRMTTTYLKMQSKYAVMWRGELVAYLPSLSRARTVAKRGNAFLRKLQVVDIFVPDPFSRALQSYLTGATGFDAGFRPALNLGS